MSFKEWEKHKISELYTITSGLSKGRKDFGFGNPFVTFKDIFYNYFLPEKLENFANTTEKEIISCSVKKGDLFLTRTSETQDELGMSSVALKDYDRATFNGFTKRLRIKEPFREKIDPIYMGYYMRGPNIRNQINSFSIMTTRASLNNAMINLFEVKIPPIEEQMQIGKILKVIDDKIHINNQINKTLENMAQAIFKQWFVDFEFPNEEGEPYQSSGGEMVESELGMIPKGWEVKSASEIVESVSIKHKFPNEKIFFLNTSDIYNGEVLLKDYSEVATLPGQAKKSIQKNDILYSEIRPQNRRFAFIDFDAEDFVVSTKLMVLRTIKINPAIPYFLLTNTTIINELQKMAEGRSGTFPQITFSNLKYIKLALPRNFYGVLKSDILNLILDNISRNRKENHKLELIRDTLLPKIMSGEIQVPLDSDGEAP